MDKKFHSGSGAYGCVVNLPIACDTTAPSFIDEEASAIVGGRVLTKLSLNSDEGKKEFGRSKLLALKDPDHSFTVRAVGYCKPNISKRNDLDIRALCHNTSPFQSLFTIENGGDTIDKILGYRKLPLKTVLKSLQNVLRGVVIMNEGDKKIVHMDIKLNNMVIDPRTNQAKLIDYGFVRPQNAIFDKDRQILLPYFIWPPEWDYLRQLLKDEASSDDEDATIISNFDKLEQTTEKIGIRRNASLRMYFRKIQIDMAGLKRRGDTPENARQFMRDFGGKLDVYSMGIAVAKILEFCYTRVLDDKSQDYIGLDKLRALKQWIFDVTEPNPYDRFTPQEALEAYAKIWTEDTGLRPKSVAVEQVTERPSSGGRKRLPAKRRSTSKRGSRRKRRSSSKKKSK
jgi:serine/threonine protein kinase